MCDQLTRLRCLLQATIVASAFLCHITEAQSLAKVGEFEVLTMSREAQAFDIDADGKDELVATGENLSLWRVVDYESTEFNYRTTRTARAPFTRRLNQSQAAQGGRQFFERGGPFDIGPLVESGPPKVVVRGEDGNVYVSDLASGEIEFSTATSNFIDINQILVRDMDDDGFAEIWLITERGIKYLNHTLSKIRQLSDLDVEGYRVAIANMDADPATELVDTQGNVFQFDGLSLTLEYSLPTVLNGSGISDVTAADVDADGRHEVIVQYGASAIAAYNVETETEVWQKFALDNRRQRARTTGDTDNDGKPDYIYSIDREGVLPAQIRVLDGETGELHWETDLTTVSVVGLAYGDFDEDASTEIIISELRPVTGPDRYVVLDVASRQIEWIADQEWPDVRALAITDLDDDGFNDVLSVAPGLIGSFPPAAIARQFDGDDLSVHSTTPAGWLGLSVSRVDGVGALAIADLDGDGEDEIIVGSGHNLFATVTVASKNTSQVQFETQFFQGARVSSIAVGDVDADGELEIVAGLEGYSTAGMGSLVFVLDGRTGAIEWQSDNTIAFFIKADSIRLGNVDADPAVEIVVSADQMHVYDLVSGEAWSTSEGEYLGFALALADSGGIDKIVAGREDGRVDVIDGVTRGIVSQAVSCQLPVNAVAENSLVGGTPDSVLIACDTRIAELEPTNDVMRGLSAPLATSTGNGNHLYTYPAANGGTRILVATTSGLQVLEPITNLSPYARSERPTGPTTTILAVHWRGDSEFSAQGIFGDHDSDDVEIRPADVEIDGLLTPVGSFSPARFDFTPNPAFESQYISFVADDGASISNVGSIAVFLTNSAPLETNRAFDIEPGEEIRVPFTGSDLDNDPLTFEITSQPNNGELIELVTNDYFVYRPFSDATGDDVVQYLISDGYESSDTATVTFSIVEPPPPPPPPEPASSGGGGAFDWFFLGLVWLIFARRGRRAKL